MLNPIALFVLLASFIASGGSIDSDDADGVEDQYLCVAGILLKESLANMDINSPGQFDSDVLRFVLNDQNLNALLIPNASASSSVAQDHIMYCTGPIPKLRRLEVSADDIVSLTNMSLFVHAKLRYDDGDAATDANKAFASLVLKVGDKRFDSIQGKAMVGSLLSAADSGGLTWQANADAQVYIAVYQEESIRAVLEYLRRSSSKISSGIPTLIGPKSRLAVEIADNPVASIKVIEEAGKTYAIWFVGSDVVIFESPRLVGLRPQSVLDVPGVDAWLRDRELDERIAPIGRIVTVNGVRKVEAKRDRLRIRG